MNIMLHGFIWGFTIAIVLFFVIYSIVLLIKEYFGSRPIDTDEIIDNVVTWFPQHSRLVRWYKVVTWAEYLLLKNLIDKEIKAVGDAPIKTGNDAANAVNRISELIKVRKKLRL